jgi:hypothetical protein
MSTYRQRANDYSNQLLKKRIRPQPNIFEKTKFVPAYQENKQPDEQNISSESAQIRKTEKEIQNDFDADIVDQNSFTNSQENGKSLSDTKTTSQSPTDYYPDLKSIFTTMWTSVDHINIPSLQYDRKSFFTPSAIAFMEILHVMETQINENDNLRWKSPKYFSLPVRLYYSVIFHVLVYRAKDAAGKITKSESSWLRAFDRRYPNVSLPIAGPLAPIAANIAAHLPSDSQFNYVYPSLSPHGPYTFKVKTETGATELDIKPEIFLSPAITLLADMLRKFCNHEGPISSDNFDENGNYVPFNLSKGGTLGGIKFPPQTQNSLLGAQFAQIFYNPGIMHPLPESQSRLNEIQNFWKRSKASEIPEIRPDEDFNPSGPSDTTLLGEDLDWFELCVESAVTQSQYFTGSTNLSKIERVAGQSVVVQSLLTFKNHKTKPSQIAQWYPQIYRNSQAIFRSTTSVLEKDQANQAASSLTCSKLNWEDLNGRKIGSKASGLKAGPFWENQKYNYSLTTETNVLTSLYTTIQSGMFIADPKDNSS